MRFCVGIQVKHTPGHTPGHMALWLNENNILIAGDAANISDGILTGANPSYTLDIEQVYISFQKIIGINPASVVCYHGGLYMQE